jgi:hypothetical protein
MILDILENYSQNGVYPVFSVTRMFHLYFGGQGHSLSAVEVVHSSPTTIAHGHVVVGSPLRTSTPRGANFFTR